MTGEWEDVYAQMLEALRLGYEGTARLHHARLCLLERRLAASAKARRR